MATTDATADTLPGEDARDEFRDAVPEAAATLRELLDAKDERIQIRAAEAILDRAGVTKGKRTRASTRSPWRRTPAASTVRPPSTNAEIEYDTAADEWTVTDDSFHTAGALYLSNQDLWASIWGGEEFPGRGVLGQADRLPRWQDERREDN